MKLFLVGGKGVWEDSKAHTLPCPVHIAAADDISTVTVNNKTLSACGGVFTLEADKCGMIMITVNDIPCEALICTNKGGTLYAHAAGTDFRFLLPIIEQLSNLENIVERHEKQLTHKDIFS